MVTQNPLPVPSDVPRAPYCDVYSGNYGPYDVVLHFGFQGPTPDPNAAKDAPVAVGRPEFRASVRMSYQHAKIFALCLRKELKAFEQQVGVIGLPPALYQSLGLTLQDW